MPRASGKKSRQAMGHGIDGKWVACYRLHQLAELCAIASLLPLPLWLYARLKIRPKKRTEGPRRRRSNGHG